jgi:tetrahedral aminopeptidase
MAIPALLDELLRAHGPPGGEADVQAIVRREAAALGAELTTDVLGGTVARIRGTGSGRLVALVAHTDQIALGITRIDDNGLLRVGPLGDWLATNAVGQRFSVRTGTGFLPAIAVRTGAGDVTWDDVRLDLGVSTAAEARTLVAAGDTAVPVAPPLELEGGRLTSVAIDNRAAVYIGLEVLRRVAADPPDWDVALVASVQEEGSNRVGAEATMASLDAEVVLVLEASYASDAASGYPAWGDLPLGGGPSVFRGPVVHPGVSGGLRAAAEAAGRPVGLETGASTMTDGDDLYVTKGGLAVGLISTPVRFVHTAHELADLADIDAGITIVETYVRSLAPEASFLR